MYVSFPKVHIARLIRCLKHLNARTLTERKTEKQRKATSEKDRTNTGTKRGKKTDRRMERKK